MYHHRRASRPLLGVASVGLALLVLGQVFSLWVVQIPYFLFSPGPTEPVGELINVPKDHRHPVTGQVLLTTVLQAQAHIADFLLSWARSNDQLISSQQVAGNLTPSQLLQLDQAEMTASQEDAQVVAMRRAGYQVTEQGAGTLVVDVVAHTPASGVLKPDDVIVGINGRATPLEQDAAQILAASPPGTKVSMQVQNQAGATRAVSVVLARRSDNAKQGFLGVELITKADRFNFPFKITIDSRGIGGPSAGLAFALGMLEELTGANITNGGRIAATGTIAPDGTVGDVGGVAQKTVSVADAGATLFLVPPGEYRDAVTHAGPHLKVVAVSTFEQALQAIARNGGSLAGLPPAPAGVK
jgi:Lon-like protease